jgi:hypothetical protein
MPSSIQSIPVAVATFVAAVAGHLRALQARARSQRGQATAEYALVLLGAAAIALLLVAWAAKSGKIGALFDAVVGQLIDKAG